MRTTRQPNAHMAFTHVNDYVNGWTDNPNLLLQTGLEIAQQALQMDKEEPQAHFAVAAACLWRRDIDKAIEEVGRCLALNPNSTEGLRLMAHIQIFSDKAADAIGAL